MNAALASMSKNTLAFYEKPGCINNTRQKVILKDAGFELDTRNLLTAPWTAAELRSFFGTLPVEQWFNRSAPAVKSGDVKPEKLTETEALNGMLADPLLIRRPLIAAENGKWAGFDLASILASCGMAEKGSIEVPANIEACPRMHTETSCQTEAGD